MRRLIALRRLTRLVLLKLFLLLLIQSQNDFLGQGQHFFERVGRQTTIEPRNFLRRRQRTTHQRTNLGIDVDAIQHRLLRPDSIRQVSRIEPEELLRQQRMIAATEHARETTILGAHQTLDANVFEHVEDITHHDEAVRVRQPQEFGMSRDTVSRREERVTDFVGDKEQPRFVREARPRRQHQDASRRRKRSRLE